MTGGDGACSRCGVVDIDVTVEDDAWQDDLPGADDIVKRACTSALQVACSREAVTMSVVMASDRMLAELNRRWRHIDRPTDVLSFPSQDRAPGTRLQRPAGSPPGGAIALGDIVIARETIVDDARRRTLALTDHLSHIVVHGTLHLLGYDHETEVDARVMENMERIVLETLGIPDPYLVDTA